MAGVNRFDKPAQAQFINTYVPIPFEAMLQAGLAKQGRYDQTAAAMDQSIANADQLMSISDSKDEEYIKGVRASMYDIRDRYGDKDWSDSMVKRKMNQEINKLDKNKVQRIQQSYAAWSQAEKYKNDLKAKGLYNPELDEDPSFGYDTDAQGVYSYGHEAYLPKEETLDRYFDEIKEPTRKGTIDDPSDINYGRDRYATDQVDIDRVVGEQTNGFAKTNSGRHEIKLWRKSNPEIEGEISDIEIASKVMDQFGQRYKREEYTGSRLDPAEATGGVGVGYTPWGGNDRFTAESGPASTMNARKAENALNDLEKSADPQEQQLGVEKREQINEIASAVAEDNKPKYDSLYSDATQKILDLGIEGIDTEEDAMFALHNFIGNQEEVAAAVGTRGVRSVGVGVANTVGMWGRYIQKMVARPKIERALLKENPDLKEGILSGDKVAILTAFEKSKEYRDEYFKNNPLKSRKKLKDKKIGDIGIEFMKAFKEIDQGETEIAENALTTVMNTTEVDDYGMALPIEISNGQPYVTYHDSKGIKRTIESQVYPAVQNVFDNPFGDGYEIVELYTPGKKDKNRKDHLDEKGILRNYTPKNIKTLAAAKKEFGYNPILLVNAEDKDGNKIVAKIRVMDPSFEKSIIHDNSYANRPETISRLMGKGIDEFVDINYSSFNEPTEFPLGGDPDSPILIIEKGTNEKAYYEKEEEVEKVKRGYRIYFKDDPTDFEFIENYSRSALKNKLHGIWYKYINDIQR